MKFLAGIILSFMLAGCAEGPKDAVLKEEVPAPVDSFTVSGIDIGQQVQGFEYISDTLLCSYNLIYRDLVYFYKTGPRSFKASVRQPIDVPSWSSHFMDGNGLHYFMSPENILTGYDAKASGKISVVAVKHIFPHIKDSFMMIASHDAPIIKQHDTLITFFAHNSLQSYPQYFKEPAMAEFKLGKDSATLIGAYMPKPAGMEHYNLPMAKYCFHNNTITLLYPCYDTIYSYNRGTQAFSKTWIHNKDYKLPAPYDHSMAFKPGYGSYLTKYLLDNFQYSAIYYNERTHHFILFYFAPVTEQFKDRMATPADQKMKAVVLDESLQAIGYLKFDIKGYVSPDSYFFVPGKGLAIPTVKSTEDYETAKFYIYNL